MDRPGEEGRILLIDDLAMLRRVLPLRLGPLGRGVVTAASAEDARRQLADRLPDLILLDVVMPGTDGLTFCRELKADPRTRHIPVIILTDLTRNAHDRSLEAGADDYMPKRMNDILMRIRVKLHMQLVALRKRDGGAPSLPGPASILLATPSPMLGVQLPAQFNRDLHRVRVVARPEDVAEALRPEDRLLILDKELGPDLVHGVLAELRMNPDTGGLPVLLMCEKDELEQLTAIEFMVDDVLWKPLNAQVTKFRLGILLELGRRLYAFRQADTSS
jgi:two-component system, cell cycle response regulator